MILRQLLQQPLHNVGVLRREIVVPEPPTSSKHNPMVLLQLWVAGGGSWPYARLLLVLR